MGIARSVVKNGMGLGTGVGALGAGIAGIGALGAETAENGWTIPEGHVAVRTRFKKVQKLRDNGRLPDVVKRSFKSTRNRVGSPPDKTEKIIPNPKIITKEGLRPTIPGTHSNRLKSCQDRNSSLGQQPMMREGKLTTVNTNIHWHVSPEGFNPYRALFHVQSDSELEQIVVSTCANGLRVVMRDMYKGMAQVKQLEDDKEPRVFTYYNEDGDRESPVAIMLTKAQKEAAYTNHIEDTDVIYNRLNYLCYEDLLFYGAVLKGISITTDAPHPVESLREALQASQTSAAASLVVASEIIPEIGISGHVLGNGVHANGNGQTTVQ